MNPQISHPRSILIRLVIARVVLSVALIGRSNHRSELDTSQKVQFSKHFYINFLVRFVLSRRHADLYTIFTIKVEIGHIGNRTYRLFHRRIYRRISKRKNRTCPICTKCPICPGGNRMTVKYQMSDLLPVSGRSRCFPQKYFRELP